MATKKTPAISKAAIAAARKRAEQTRQQLGHKPGPSDLLTPQELADAAPFYFVLRDYIRQLKEARDAAGLTLADVAARTGMAVESLSRLETGALTNPTWKTLGAYAAAVGRRPQLVVETAGPNPDEASHRVARFTPPREGTGTTVSGVVSAAGSSTRRVRRIDRLVLRIDSANAPALPEESVVAMAL